MNKTLKQNIFYVAIAAIILIFLLLLKPASNYQPKGVFLPTKVKVSEPSSHIKVLAALPSSYKTIGIISAALYQNSSTPSRQNEKRIILFALKKAAKHGANGLAVKQLFFAPKNQVGALAAGYNLIATAIRTKDAK